MEGYLVRSDASMSYLEWSEYDQRFWWGAGEVRHAAVFSLADAVRHADEQRAKGVPDARVVRDLHGRQAECLGEEEGAA